MSLSFADPAAVENALRAAGYLADPATGMTVFLAQRLGKPLLIEGPAGTGKTELAKALARMTQSRLIRLQCYEGLDESKALYEWDYRKQLLRISAPGADWTELQDDIFGEDFLLPRPLLEAIRSEEAAVLLIDEVDRVELETEALFLEVLSDYQVSIPELGTLVASQVPLVVLTSNNSRELSEALKRRCLFLHLDYPSPEREKEILRLHIPGIDERLASEVSKAVAVIRNMDLQKRPSISEGIDWARALLATGRTAVTNESLREGLPLLLKYQSDIEKAYSELTPTP